MIKIFIFSLLVLGGILVFFAYKFKGTAEYEENFSGMKIVFVIYLSLGTLMIILQPEIKDFMSQNRRIEEIPAVETTVKRKSSEIEETVIGVVLRKSLVIADVSDVDNFVAAVKRKDVAFLDRMVSEGRAYFVTSDARVYRSNSGIYDGVVFITFLEGRFTNQRGYTFLKCVPTEEEYLASKEKMYIPDSKR